MAESRTFLLTEKYSKVLILYFYQNFMVDAQNQRELTYGEKAVGFTFNPSGDEQVAEIKKGFAAIIDALNHLRSECPNPGEKGAMYTIAIREAQAAQMWAVKAITWKY